MSLVDPSLRVPLESLAVFPLPNTVFFPEQRLPLHIFEPRYRQMVRDALEAAPYLVVARMEAGETPHEGIAREVKEETNLDVSFSKIVGAYDFQRMNQVIIAYHVVADGEVRLSPELVDYRLYDLPELKCWPAGTGYALADWLRTRGHEPVFFTQEENEERRRGLKLPPEEPKRAS